MFPLSRYVPGIATLHSAVPQPARGITNTNLTPWYGTLIVSVPGHEVRQDTATFTVGATLMVITFELMCITWAENMQVKRSSNNLGRPRSNCSWWILTFWGLTRSSVAKSSDRAHRGHRIHFRLLRHNNLLFELLLLYMLDESWEIKMGKAKPLMRGAQINSFTLEVVPGQRRAREIRDWAVIQCGRLSRSSRCTHHLSHQETTQSQRLHGERMVRGGCGEHKW